MNPLVVQGAAQFLLGKYKSEKGMFMKNILTMAATGLVIFAGLGWYLDWYKVARTTTPDGNQHFVIDVNTKGIESDIAKGRDQVTGYLQNNGVAFPSPTPPAPYPNQSYPQQYPIPQQTAPNQAFFPQPPTTPAPGYQQPAQQGWLPATSVNRPNTGGYVVPGQQNAPPPAQNIPGRPF